MQRRERAFELARKRDDPELVPTLDRPRREPLAQRRAERGGVGIVGLAGEDRVKQREEQHAERREARRKPEPAPPVVPQQREHIAQREE